MNERDAIDVHRKAFTKMVDVLYEDLVDLYPKLDYAHVANALSIALLVKVDVDEILED